MTAIDRIRKDLPITFTRQDVLEVGKELGYSYSTANSFIEKALYQELIQKVDTGKYKKTA